MQTFRDFMESSLYAPGHGYYQARVPAEDFYTAPELHPAFAGVLAEEAASRLDALLARGVPEPYQIVEMGSGSGALCRDMLRLFRERHARWAGRVQPVLVERCERLLFDSVLGFSGRGESVRAYPRLEDVPPGPGIFLSNELVDAFPVHLLEKKGEEMLEVYVDEGKESLGALSTRELAPFADSMTPHLAEGQRHSVNLEAARWMRQVACAMTSGSVITVDYGKRFRAGAPNSPRHFYRHAAGAELVDRAGRQDLTASVDFELLVREGERSGLRTAFYGSLARFLMDRGVLDWMPRSKDATDLSAWRERNRIKTLLHPDGMGEAYKVLIQEKS